MQITNVGVYPNPKAGTLRAYVDINLDDLSVNQENLG
jgi:DNA-binding cell septation regulator SpoVG